jgi:hypothetical protein
MAMFFAYYVVMKQRNKRGMLWLYGNARSVN